MWLVSRAGDDVVVTTSTIPSTIPRIIITGWMKYNLSPGIDFCNSGGHLLRGLKRQNLPAEVSMLVMDLRVHDHGKYQLDGWEAATCGDVGRQMKGQRRRVNGSRDALLLLGYHIVEVSPA